VDLRFLLFLIIDVYNYLIVFLFNAIETENVISPFEKYHFVNKTKIDVFVF